MEKQDMGENLGRFTIDWGYLIVFFTFFGVIFFAVVRYYFGSDLGQVFALVWIVVSSILLFAMRQSRPRIHLYENAVHVIDKGKNHIWTWDELSHAEGQIVTFSFYFIPLLRLGYTTFFAEGEKVFRVGAMTNNADVLVDYCTSRLVEKHIPALVAKVQNNENIQQGEIIISAGGIGGKRSFYEWERINGPWFSKIPSNVGYSVTTQLAGYVVTVTSQESTLRDIIGTVSDSNAYTLMALIDALHETTYLPNLQRNIVYSEFSLGKRRILKSDTGIVLFVRLLIVGLVIALWLRFR